MKTKSFTLIEVLVALVILGILSTFIIISLNNVVDSSNDAKRKKDLDSVSKMLMTYGVLNGSYPTGSGNLETVLSSLVPDYTTSFPKDPSGSSYTYISDEHGSTYTITANLSNGQTLSYNPEDGFSQGEGSGGPYESWLYRKEITLSNSGSELTDYQLKFTINRTTGTDSGFTTYVGTKCLDSYNDIRFIKSDETTLLDYWIESSSSSTATIWVEVDTIAASGNTTIYLYYGNVAAAVASNGTNTFPFFDDFDGASVDSSKWTVSGAVTQTSSVISVAANNSNNHYCYSSVSTTSTSVTEMYIRTSHLGNTSGSEMFLLTTSDLSFANYIGAFPSNEYGNANKYRQIKAGAGVAGTALSGWSVNTWLKYKIVRTGSSSVHYINDGSSVTLSNDYYPTVDLPIVFFARNNGYKVECDWVFIRSYTVTEPTVSAWGAEE